MADIDSSKEFGTLNNIGLSIKEVNKLKKVFDTNLKKFAKSVSKNSSNSDLNQLIKLIQNNWHGEDADRFVQNLVESSSELSQIILDMNKKVNDCLDNYVNSFKSFQSKQASTLSKISIK